MRLLVVAGTADGREVALALKARGHHVVVSVVTASAAQHLRETGLATVVGRRVGEEAWLELLHAVDGVVDASHPFAVEVSRQVRGAAQRLTLPYWRYERAPAVLPAHEALHWACDFAGAATLAAQLGGPIFLTTGVGHLHLFLQAARAARVRLVCRILPSAESLAACVQHGLPQEDIVAIRGPFSPDLNRALYLHFGARTLVTKESGSAGAVAEKVLPALELGLQVVVIQRPRVEYGQSMDSLDRLCEAVALAATASGQSS